MTTSSRQKHNLCSTFFVLSPLLLQFYSGKSDLQLNFYAQSCPNAEEIIKQEVIHLIFKILLKHKGLLQGDQELASDPVTSTFVEKMSADNGYFQDQFPRAIFLVSENNPLTGDEGEIRKDCRYVNQ
ncbi:hypothetical protein SLE2022_077170 [Rubroshorea leprosula]